MTDACLKMGMYGGAFNPVHNTHLKVAQAVTSELELDRLIWVPTGNAWHKTGQLTKAAHRIAMLNQAFSTLPYETVQNWEISTLEVNDPGLSYTVNTLKQLQAMYVNAKWYVVIGADQLSKLHMWKDWRILTQHATLAVLARQDIVLAPSFIHSLTQQGVAWVNIPMQSSGESSTQIRRLVQQAAQGDTAASEQLKQRLPVPVVNYIQNHHLYE